MGEANLMTRINGYINSGRYRQACRFYQDINGTYLGALDKLPESAEFHYFGGLAELLVHGDTNDFYAFWERAKNCNNYTYAIEGDFWRDVALSAINQNVLDIAREAIICSEEYLNENDISRVNCLMAVKGMLFLAQGNIQESCRCHYRADYSWRSEGVVKSFWAQTNRFHWLRALSAAGVKPQRQCVYDVISANEPRLNYRLRALALNVTGQIGFEIDRFMSGILPC